MQSVSLGHIGLGISVSSVVDSPKIVCNTSKLVSKAVLPQAISRLWMLASHGHACMADAEIT